MNRIRCENNDDQCNFCAKINSAKVYILGGTLCEFGQHLQEEHRRTSYNIYHANLKMRGDKGPGICGWCFKTHTDQELIKLNQQEKELIKDCQCEDCKEWREINGNPINGVV